MAPRPLVALVILFVLAQLAAPARAALSPDEMLDDAALEARARSISLELRCLVCQNQSIDDSDAPLARDLRLLVRERLEAGDSDAEVIAFIEARYGEYVLMRPRLAPHTLVLWATPFALLALGGVAVLAALRRRGAASAADALTPEERQRLEAILDERPSP